MTYEAFISLLTYAVVTTFTPGPNTILSLSTACQYGFKKTLKLLSGIWAGVFCAMTVCGLASFALSEYLPEAAKIMKYIGGAYILWLSWRVATSKPPSADNPEAKPPEFLTGFFLQLANIKIMFYGVTAFTGFILPYAGGFTSVMAFSVLLTLISASGVVAWALCGAVFQRFLSKYSRIVNILLALLLVRCAFKLILG